MPSQCPALQTHPTSSFHHPPSKAQLLYSLLLAWHCSTSFPHTSGPPGPKNPTLSHQRGNQESHARGQACEGHCPVDHLKNRKFEPQQWEIPDTNPPGKGKKNIQGRKNTKPHQPKKHVDLTKDFYVYRCSLLQSPGGFLALSFFQQKLGWDWMCFFSFGKTFLGGRNQLRQKLRPQTAIQVITPICIL